jgi:hypothetical protein
MSLPNLGIDCPFFDFSGQFRSHTPLFFLLYSVSFGPISAAGRLRTSLPLRLPVATSSVPLCSPETKEQL